ncbi:MAG TPA: PIN domain-containing protein [Acidobacteriota bacterium]|nr:PIN domain-containing protein [Acidobacteriota bacterium]
MTSVILDTGPLVALLNRRERHHAWAREILDTIEPPVFTCDPVLSEACFLLQNTGGGSDAVLELMSRGIVRSDFRVSAELDSLRALMKKFASVPMSLADACLVRMTELDRESAVLTLDGDFTIYRRNRRQTVPIISPDQ